MVQIPIKNEIPLDWLALDSSVFSLLFGVRKDIISRLHIPQKDHAALKEMTLLLGLV